jgi:transmembrane sensor
MPDGFDIDWPLLERHLAGESAPADDAAIARWLASDPAHGELLDALREIWNRNRARPRRYDADAAWATLERAMDERATPADVRPLRTHRATQPAPASRARPAIAWGARIAALLLIAAGIGIVWRVIPPRRSASIVQPALLREVATAKGQHATIQLVDGSRVELGVDSKLRYAPEFGNAGRDVYLDGEAYFEVTHDATKQFVVHTAHAVVRDIGTKFDVRAYTDARRVEVVVAQGAVALKAATVRSTKQTDQRGDAVAPGTAAPDSLVLTAADLGRVDADGRLSAEHQVDVAAHLAWTEGRLVFIDTPLRDVVPQLNRWYNADVRLGDSTLATLRYTATLDDESLPQLLTLLSAALDVRVERHGATVTLYPKHRPHPHQ